MLDRKAEFLINLGSTVGKEVEDHLHVPYASLVDPRDLAVICAMKLGDGASQNYLRSLARPSFEQVSGRFYSAIYQKAGITEAQFAQIYPALVGKSDPLEGKIAQALDTAQDKLEDRYDAFVERSAQLYVHFIDWLKPSKTNTERYIEYFIGMSCKGKNYLNPAKTSGTFIGCSLGLGDIGLVPGMVSQVESAYVVISGNDFTQKAFRYSLLLAKANGRVTVGSDVSDVRSLAQKGLAKKVDAMLVNDKFDPKPENWQELISQSPNLLKQTGKLLLEYKTLNPIFSIKSALQRLGLSYLTSSRLAGEEFEIYLPMPLPVTWSGRV